MKTRRIMLCSLVSLIMVFVMAVPMTVSADTVTHVKNISELQNAIKNGGEIVLDADITGSITIPADKTVTLDLNGKSLTGGSDDTIYVSSGAVLTIKGDGAVKASATSKAAVFNNGTTTLDNGYYTRSQGNWYTIVNHGTMTINDVKVDASIDKTSSLIENGYYSYTSTNERSGHVDKINAVNPKLTINGGDFTASGLNVVKNDDGGVLEINDGTFNGAYINPDADNPESQKKDNRGSIVLNWNQATINGGTFIAKNHTNVVATGAYNGDVDKGITTIKNGTFKASEKASVFAYGLGGNAQGTLTVSDGDFSGSLGLDKTTTAYITTLTGGIYDNDPSQYAEENKIVIKVNKANSQDGKYYIGIPSEIQEIANSAESGDSIEVLHGEVNLTINTPGVTVRNPRGTAKVVINGTKLEEGMELTVPEKTEPTTPSQDPSQKPADNAKADKNVATGDDFNMLAAGGAALAAIIAMAAVVITGRRQRQK